MRKILFSILCFLLVFTSCKREPINIVIDEQALIEDLRTLADDSYQGRLFSSEQNYRARSFIANNFEKIGLEKVLDSGYEQEFSATLTKRRRQDIFPIKKNPLDDYSNVPDTTLIGGNVIGMLKGETNKYIVITAHFDHLGVKGDRIYNGADDNASGTSALFAIAKYFKDKPLKHNLIFAAVDAEEVGSLGAKYFLDNFKEKDNIVLNINMDMISHSDYDPELFGCGLFYFPELRDPLEDIYSEKVTLLFGHDDPSNREQADWTNSSDHRVFFEEDIPFMYFGVEDHKDYHRHTDTFATINPDFYIEAVKIIIQAVQNLDTYLYEESL